MKSLVPRLVMSSLALALAFSAGCGLVGQQAYSCQAFCYNEFVGQVTPGNTASITANSADDAESRCSADSFPDGTGCPAGTFLFECACQ